MRPNLLVCALLSLYLVACADDDNDDGDTSGHTMQEWGYLGAEGPHHWFELDEAYGQRCGE